MPEIKHVFLGIQLNYCVNLLQFRLLNIWIRLQNKTNNRTGTKFQIYFV